MKIAHGDQNSTSPDPELLSAWLRARSLGRGLPSPVPVAGGWKVHTDAAQERARYVFASPCDGLSRLARAISTPRVFLKVCARDDVLRALTPARWSLRPSSWLMTHDGDATAAPPPPPGYAVSMTEEGPTRSVFLHDQAGGLAATGHATEAGGVLAFDQIETRPAHRRRGLGRAVMSALMATRRLPGVRPVLVATAEGRALYLSLGWAEHAPYATAVIEP